MLCCVVIALLLSPLGVMAGRAAGRPACCRTPMPAWPFALGGALALAICGWLAFAGGDARFHTICTAAGGWARRAGGF